jgi:hypothetical protein
MNRTATEEQRKIIKEKHRIDGKVRCFVNNHPIDDEKDIEFHHIKPWSFKQETLLDNLAPVCKDHHRRIGILSIEEYRSKLAISEFFKSKDPKKLNDVLEEKIGRGNFGKNLNFEIKDEKIIIYFSDKIKSDEFQLYVCPATGFKYFYITLPVKYLSNDEKLQPRPIEEKRLWDLYVHLNTHTQLSPAICRLVNKSILLFDGQHKSAAQIWAGRKQVECKVYIEPDEKTLKETNLAAHDKLRQMNFFTSVLISKWADIFKDEWEEFLEIKGVKSEKEFVNFLVGKGKKKADATNMLKSNIIDSVLEDSENNIVEYITERNRTRKNPLTINSLKQTIFKYFVANPPLDIEIDKSDELREKERKNIIRLLNILTEITLTNKWNPDKNDASYKKSVRIYKSGSIKAWSKMLKDIIAVVLRIYDEDKKSELFLRTINDEEWELIKGRIEKLFNHKLWTDPKEEIDSNLGVNTESHVKEFFEKEGLTVESIVT